MFLAAMLRFFHALGRARTSPQQSATQAQLEADSREVPEKENKLQVEGEAWCERGESNPHGFPRQILSLVRLPIPPLSH